MQIQKIQSNKRLGIVSAILGVVVILTATEMLTLAGGLFLLIMGAILWWINR